MAELELWSLNNALFFIILVIIVIFVTIFGINDMFNFYHNNYHHDEESERYNRQVDDAIWNVVNLIEICWKHIERVHLPKQE